MPPKALANVNWGGREHPKYQQLSMATQQLLGLGVAFMRLVLLKSNQDAEASDLALVGNTVCISAFIFDRFHVSKKDNKTAFERQHERQDSFKHAWHPLQCL